MADKVQQLLDEHKEELSDGLYLKLCNANMERHEVEVEEDQVWVDVTFVYFRLDTIIDDSCESYIIPKTYTAPMRTSRMILSEPLPLSMNLYGEGRWVDRRGDSHRVKRGKLGHLIDETTPIRCPECDYIHTAKFLQPNVQVIKVSLASDYDEGVSLALF